VRCVFTDEGSSGLKMWCHAGNRSNEKAVLGRLLATGTVQADIELPPLTVHSAPALHVFSTAGREVPDAIVVSKEISPRERHATARLVQDFRALASKRRKSAPPAHDTMTAHAQSHTAGVGTLGSLQ
jgi:hypothetical protein